MNPLPPTPGAALTLSAPGPVLPSDGTQDAAARVRRLGAARRWQRRAELAARRAARASAAVR